MAAFRIHGGRHLLRLAASRAFTRSGRAAIAASAAAAATLWSCNGDLPSHHVQSKPAPRHEASLKIEADYELGEDLGSGSFAVVRKGRCRKTGKTVAIKVVPKDRMSEDSIRNECAVLQRVSLHNCIASLEAFYEESDSFFIVMEFVAGAYAAGTPLPPGFR